MLNIYHDKRIAFGNEHYKMHTNLAILHWNENADREFTSVWKPYGADIASPRIQHGKKTYKEPTFIFKRHIWRRYMDKLYTA